MTAADLSALLDQLKERPQIRGPVVIAALADVAQAADKGLKTAQGNPYEWEEPLVEALARLRSVLAGEPT